jgi:hypothetical protein
MVQKAIGFEVGYVKNPICRTRITDLEGEIDHHKLVYEIDKKGQEMYFQYNRFGRI